MLLWGLLIVGRPLNLRVGFLSIEGMFLLEERVFIRIYYKKLLNEKQTNKTKYFDFWDIASHLTNNQFNPKN